MGKSASGVTETDYTTFFVSQAQNDYLQLLAETGIAGFAIAVWFLVLVFRQVATKLKDWNETSTGVLTVSALLGCVGILVHSLSLLDFNLQSPANAALFYVLCAIAASQPLREFQKRRVFRRRSVITEISPKTTPPDRKTLVSKVETTLASHLRLGRYLVATGITKVIWASFGVFSVI